MGQGNASTCARLAARVLGQEPQAVELVQPDTDLCLPSGSASASRTTYSFGQATLGAAELMRQRLRQRVADALLGAAPEEVALLPGRAVHLPSGRELPLAALAAMLNPALRQVVHHHRATVSSQRPSPDQALTLHGLPHAVFSYAAQMAAVEVDELTGAVRVERFVSVVDCGRIIDQPLAEQQVEGAVLQGLGYGLMEEFLADEGRVLTPDLATYIIPTALDAPEMETAFAQTFEESGPLGMKGVGEVAVDGPLPAAANALRDACGVSFHDFPLTPERVLRGLAQGAGR
jgi:CO/xanthine dehydrogenase Mo-binding subunit